MRSIRAFPSPPRARFVVLGVAAAFAFAFGCASRGESGFSSTQGPAPLDDAGAPSFGDCGLKCRQVSCANGGTTSVSGVVRAPTRIDPDPLYNALVYVP